MISKLPHAWRWPGGGRAGNFFFQNQKTIVFYEKNNNGFSGFNLCFNGLSSVFIGLSSVFTGFNVAFNELIIVDTLNDIYG